MEVAIGEGGAVGGDEQIRVREPRGVDGRELDLHRPLGKLAGNVERAGRLRRGLKRRGAGAGAGVRRGGLGGFDGGFVICRGLARLKGDRARGAGGQTVAQAVAVVLAHEARLAVHHGDGPLVAGAGAGAAAVALFFINANDLAKHGLSSIVFLYGKV